MVTLLSELEIMQGWSLHFYDELSHKNDDPRFLRVNDNGHDSTIDIMFANHVIEHMTKPGKLFEDATHLLKRGGILVVEAPAPNGIHYDLTRSRTWGGYHAPRHLTLLKKEALEALGKQHGLEVVYSEHLDDSWIWLQTLNNIYKTNRLAAFVLYPIKSAFLTGDKEKPTAVRRNTLSLLRRINRIITRADERTSIIRVIYRKR
jgi:hypothetical protein